MSSFYYPWFRQEWADLFWILLRADRVGAGDPFPGVRHNKPTVALAHKMTRIIFAAGKHLPPIRIAWWTTRL